MGFSERLKYFFRGMGSVLDLSGSYSTDSSEVIRRYSKRDKTPQQIDAEAIASDWRAVGNDLSSVMSRELP